MRKLKLTILLAVMAALLCFACAQAYAADPDISDRAGLENLFANGGRGRLTANIVLNGDVTIPSGKTVTIDLNGKMLMTYGHTIVVNGGTFTVNDTGSGGTVLHGYGMGADPVVRVSSGSFYLENGAISGGAYGGVSVEGGNFNMSGGSVGGVMRALTCNAGTAYLYGGTISGAWSGSGMTNATIGVYLTGGTVVYGGTSFSGTYIDFAFGSAQSRLRIGLGYEIGNRVYRVALEENIPSLVFTEGLLFAGGSEANFAVPAELAAGTGLRMNGNEAEIYRKYTVNVNSPTGCTLSVDKQTAEAGETVAVSVSVNSGYILFDVTMTPAGGQTQTLSRDANGKFPFEMPASNVTVSAAVKRVPYVISPSANSLTYDGTEQALVSGGSTTGGTLEYALGDASAAPADGWSEEVPTAVDAGTYRVWYRVTGNENYVGAQPAGPLTAEIARRAVAVCPDITEVLPNTVIPDDPSLVSVVEGSLAEGDTIAEVELDGQYDTSQLSPSGNADNYIFVAVIRIEDAAGRDVTDNYAIDFRLCQFSVRIPLRGSGEADAPYQIRSDADWEILAAVVNQGYDTAGLYFSQHENITADVMVGTQSHPFRGSYNGNGYCVTVSLTGASGYTAPFPYVNGAVFSNLKTDGVITVTGGTASGLVGSALGDCTITNCAVYVEISGSNGGGHAGFAAMCSGGTVSVTGSVFGGSITDPDAGYCAGFLGWQGNTADNCVYAGLMQAGGNSNDFIRTNNYAVNCYYLNKMGIDRIKGRAARFIRAGEGVELAFVGESTTYDVSGITSYPVGLKYWDDFIAGNGQTVTLSLSCEAPEGFEVRYTANAGTLVRNGSVWNLTVPDTDVVISAEFVPVFGEPDFVLPAETRRVEEEAFAGAFMTVAVIPDGCESLGSGAFAYCTGLTRISIPENCVLGEGVFDGCGTVYVFGTAGSDAERYCGENDNCVFVDIDAAVVGD